jgi:EAL domain-containing protein (putative c-di-GMP-specific phosphodiesterase class I)
MRSLPRQKTSDSSGDVMPFASYAQVVRMLVPPVYRVGFYDPRGRALWVSDGIEEPEFRMHVDLVIARFVANRPDESRESYGATDLSNPIFAFPIRDASQKLLGVIGMLCRELPANAAYRRSQHVERLLDPILEIISYGWRAQIESASPTAREMRVAKTDAPSQLPALLRRVLTLGTRSLGAAFGAVIAADRPFTLNHRVSPDESDLAINAAIDNVRTDVLQWMKGRNQALISNSAGSGKPQQLPYKLLAFPLRAAPNQLAAVIMVFREKNAPDFGSTDVAALAQIAAQLPATMLRELVPAPRHVQPMPAVAKQADAAPESAADAVKPVKTQPAATSVTPTAHALIPRATVSAPVLSKPIAQPRVKPVVPPTLSVELQRTTAMRGASTMDERVRIALREDCFDLYVQKISPLHDSQRGERFEVLLRMNDGETLYPPNVFFAAAEASELMPDVDEWVVRQLMSTLREHAAAMRTKCWEFAINIAAQSLLTDRFSEFVLQEIGKSSIPAGLLVFEVSEGDAIEHQYSLGILASRLHQAGCRIALDNCRAGLRTFDSVRKWPVSCVKIDGSVIRNVVSNSRCESQVRAVAKMAKDMGIETVAECVESEGIRELLQQMGFDYAQGFHLGKPHPLSTLFKQL